MGTIVNGTASIGTKLIRRDYPFEYGLTSDTLQKDMELKPTEKDLVTEF